MVPPRPPPPRAPPGRGEHARARRGPTDPVDDDGGDRLGPRAGAARRGRSPDGVAADRGRQHLAEQQRDERRLEQPAEARLAPAAGDEQHAPALGHHEHRDQVDGERQQEPRRRERGAASASLRGLVCQSTAAISSDRERDLDRDAPRALHRGAQPVRARVRVAQHADRRRRCRRASAPARAAATAPARRRARRAGGADRDCAARYQVSSCTARKCRPEPISASVSASA